MKPVDKFDSAMRMAVQHKEHVDELTMPIISQLWLAATLADRIEVETDLAFSWLRWDEIPQFPPVEEQWKSDEGQLWVADVVAPAGSSGIEVGKRLRKLLVQRGIARDGEAVYFFRYRTRRFGSLIARG